MKGHALAAAGLALATGTAFVIRLSTQDSGAIPAAIGDVEVLRSAYSEWKEVQAEAGGSRALVIGLGWTKAFTTEFAQGEGSAKFDLVGGTVDVQVRGLCSDEPVDVWLVENVEGKGKSVAPEDGDRMVDLGRLAYVDDAHVLRGPIPPELLGNFSLDLVVVTRAGTLPSQDGLLYGTPDLFQRLYVKELQASRRGVAPKANGMLLALVAPLEGEESLGSADDLAGLVEEGEKLFFNGTFSGNGRTCGTCHPAENNLTLDPQFIATLPDSDPLFVAEPGHPSGFLSLQFPHPQSLGHRFENPVLMRGQALILENVDGFAPFLTPSTSANDRFAMRGIPHVFAQRVSIRAPDQFGGPPLPKQRTGWSGDGSPFLDPALPGSNGTLRFFAAGAVRQHFTKHILRRPGIDFVFPTDAELDAMEAFQLTLGRQSDVPLSSFTLLDPDAQTGMNLFAGSRCNACHNEAGAGLIGSQDPNGIRINFNFNTGVERFLTNHPDNTGEPRPPDGGFGLNPAGDFTSLQKNDDTTDGIFGNKEFNTPSLIELADTLPAFHNNITSIPGQNALPNTVEGAILFYRSFEFDQSPSGPAISFGAAGTAQVGKFLRVVNALHNKDESYEHAKRALGICQSFSFDAATVNRLLRVSVADASDGIEVLEPVGLHPTARAKFAAARQEFEGAMAGSAASRAIKIERGLGFLNEAEADMRTIP